MDLSMTLLEAPINPLLPHSIADIIVGIVFMLLIFLVMWKLVVPKFEKAYADRVETIQGGIERAETATSKAEAALAKYNKQLEAAHTDANEIREEAKALAAKIIAEAHDKAAKEAERINVQAKASIEAEREAAVRQLRGEIGMLATVLAGKIIGEVLEDDNRAKRTVDQFLTELESGVGTK